MWGVCHDVGVCARRRILFVFLRERETLRACKRLYASTFSYECVSSMRVHTLASCVFGLGGG